MGHPTDELDLPERLSPVARTAYDEAFPWGDVPHMSDERLERGSGENHIIAHGHAYAARERPDRSEKNATFAARCLAERDRMLTELATRQISAAIKRQPTPVHAAGFASSRTAHAPPPM